MNFLPPSSGRTVRKAATACASTGAGWTGRTADACTWTRRGSARSWPSVWAAPDLRPGQPVRVLNGRTAEGVGPLFDLTRVASAPIRGFDGRWYVAVVLMGRGLVHVPASDVQTTKERG